MCSSRSARLLPLTTYRSAETDFTHGEETPISQMKTLSLLLSVGFCVLSGYSFGREVPFRQVVIDRTFSGDAKAIGDIDGEMPQEICWWDQGAWTLRIYRLEPPAQ